MKAVVVHQHHGTLAYAQFGLPDKRPSSISDGFVEAAIPFFEVRALAHPLSYEVVVQHLNADVVVVFIVVKGPVLGVWD
tara:strand:- start:697 stop:933 length:237 start_codon:yes stop_codon:yes gene_type:complete